MKTEIISVYSTGDGREMALDITERTGAYCRIDKQSVLRLRLLSEELIELLRPFAGDIRGDFWLETTDNKIEIHLKTEIPMDRKTKDELLSVSSSGKNSASKGLIGKIRDMISTLTLPEDPEMKILTDQALGMMSFGCQMGTHYGDAYTWSMNAYATSINKESSGAEEEKDELEKSIVGNLADEVKVSITGSKVEVVIYKAF